MSFLVARHSCDLLLSAQQQSNREWWEKERRHYNCIGSEEVVRKAMQGNNEMAQARIKVLEEMQVVEITAEVEAMSHIHGNGGTAANDAAGCVASGRCNAERSGLFADMELSAYGQCPCAA